MDVPLSIEKSLVIHYGTNNLCYQYYCEERELPSSVTFVDIDVVRCSNATYSEQVTTVAHKGRRLVGLCSRLLSYRNADFMLRAYKTYVLPVTLYASVIWYPHLHYEVEDLEAVQRLDNLQLLSLESARWERDLLTAFKLIHGKMEIYVEDVGLHLCHCFTRGGGFRLQQEYPASALLQSLFKYGVSSLWNSLPLNILKIITVASFRKHFRQRIIEADCSNFDWWVFFS